MTKSSSKPYGENEGRKADYPLQFVSADIKGPFPPSPSGNRYALDIRCRYSGYAWTRAIANKSDAAGVLMSFIEGLIELKDMEHKG
jgi:hypothetical protein